MTERNPIPAALTVVVALLAGACGSDNTASTATESGNGTSEANSSSTSPVSGGSDDGLSYPLVDTGQTTFYDNEGEIDEPTQGEAFYGQDAAYEGNQSSYTDNGDGTVSDNVTGLVWEQDPTDTKTVWTEAGDHCDALSLGGSDDWRNPSLKELFSISDFSTGWPYLDTDYFELVEARQDKDQQYWSSNHYDVGTELAAQNSAFGVNHATGHIKAYPDGSVGSIRCRPTTSSRGRSVAGWWSATGCRRGRRRVLLARGKVRPVCFGRRVRQQRVHQRRQRNCHRPGNWADVGTRRQR